VHHIDQSVKMASWLPSWVALGTLLLLIGAAIAQQTPPPAAATASGGDTKRPEQFAENLLECAQGGNVPFDICLRMIMEDLRTQMTIGFPEFGIGPTEPLSIRNLKFLSKPQLSGAVSVNAEFTNVVVEGLSNFETVDVKADLVNRNLFIKMRVPDIRIRGFYKAEGKALVVTLKGDGPFTANLKEAVGQGFSRIVEIGPPENRSLSVVDTDIDFTIGDLKIELRNLFGGKYPALAKTTNDFLNLNSHRIIEEIKPQIKFEVTRLFQTVMAQAFSKLPIESFLEKIQQAPRSNRSLKQSSFKAAATPRKAQGIFRRPQFPSLRSSRRLF